MLERGVAETEPFALLVGMSTDGESLKKNKKQKI